jgi:hypothetical protein|tara:strand:+ start:1297 stop:1701 length:405 start_codon:yes stop_codon:yes gene_type:complete
MGTQKLNEYLASQYGKCFQLGVHDCFTFTNAAWRETRGAGYADDFVGKYVGLGPKAFARLMIATWGTPDIIKAFDINLTKVEGFPPRGSLVAMKSTRFVSTGYALGICSGVTSVFLGDLNMVHLPTENIEGAWT